MRAPRPRPDLRLAESYIPGVLTWVKGIIYTSMCIFLVQYGSEFNNNNNNGKVLVLRIAPILILYYDHIFLNSNNNGGMLFIDSTSICTDVLAGTIAGQLSHIDMSCNSMWCSSIAILWTIMGSCHIFFGDGIIPKNICHMFTAFFIMIIMSFSKGSIFIQSGITLASSVPFFARSVTYLILVIVDAYTLRQPTQREKDRIGLIRYGPALFSTSIYLVFCIIVLFCFQIAKIYSIYQNNNICGGGITTYQQFTTSSNSSNSDNNNNMHAIESGMSSCIQDNSSNGSNYCSKNGSLNIINNNNIIPMACAPSSLLISASQRSQSISVDNLDIQEAFKLAKLQYMNGKATL
jgi:hypothetical protein